MSEKKTQAEEKAPHVIVIGGGPAGYTAALRLRKGGAAVTLIEEREIGGVCVHRGCIPTRTCLNAVKAFQQAAPLAAGQMEQRPDRQKLAAQIAEKSRRVAFGMMYMLEKSKVTVINSRAALSGEKEVALADGSRLECDRLLIAAGSRPRVPRDTGSARVYTVESLLSLEDLPDQITIVGAGILGTELAAILAALGIEARLMEKEDQILPGWDRDISRRMAAWLRSLGVEVCTGAAAGPEPEKAMVFCTGRTPDLPELAPGLDVDSPWIYLAGDAAGGRRTADQAMEEGRQAADQILRDLGLAGAPEPRSGAGQAQAARADEPRLPHASCVFTPLEAAMTGALSGPGLREAWIDAAMQPSGVLFDTEYGFVKAVMDEKSHVLKGFHIVSSMASELVTACQTAIASQMRAEDFLALTFAHPIEGELLQDAVRRLL